MSKERTGTTVVPAALDEPGETTFFTPVERLEEEVKYSCIVGEVRAKTLFMHLIKIFKQFLFTKNYGHSYSFFKWKESFNQE